MSCNKPQGKTDWVQILDKFGWTKKNLLERDLNLRPPDWRAGALALAQLVEPRHVNPEVAGSSAALVNFSLFIQIYLWSFIVNKKCLFKKTNTCV